MTPQQLARIGHLQETRPEVRSQRQDKPKTSFTDVMFSKHASLRLESRNISLTDEQMDRVQGGLGLASQKGIRDSLVLVDDVALVVNVPSRIVVTAIDKPLDNVFTKIDGAVIV